MRTLGLALLLLSPSLPARALSPEPAATLAFSPRPAARSGLAAVAFDAREGRIAVGDARGALAGPTAAGLAPLATRAPVRALTYAPDGTLLVGTEDGLLAQASLGALEDRSPGPGEEARRIARLASAPGVVAAATAAGLFVSGDGRRWQRVPGPGPATAVALRILGDSAEVFCVAAGDVHGAPLGSGGSGPPEALVPLPGLEAGVRAGAVDVAVLGSGDLVVVTPDRLAVRPFGATAFRTLRPVLPPGAAMARLLAAAGRVWLATDRGLLGAGGPEGPFDRPAAHLPASAVHDLAGDERRILAASESGLLEGALSEAGESRAAALREARLELEFPARREPPVEAVYRAALDYLELRPEEVRSLRRGLAVRGLLPELTFRLERGRASDGVQSFDESFVSGDTRRLFDITRGDERETVATVTLAWELGRLAYDADAVDLSREARAVIQLRDDVLDEISQLYFERRRVLTELASLGPEPPPTEAWRLRLRADELAAGLDAWTGGWFGREAPPLER